MNTSNTKYKLWEKYLMAARAYVVLSIAVLCPASVAQNHTPTEVNICDIKSHINETIILTSTIRIFDIMTPVILDTTQCQEKIYVSIGFSDESDPLNLEIDRIFGDTDLHKSIKYIHFTSEVMVKKDEYELQNKARAGREYIVFFKRTFNFEYK